MTPTRLFDLARYARGYLFDAGLLTEEEYAELCADHESLGRLEAEEAGRVVKDSPAVLYEYGRVLGAAWAATRITALAADRDTLRAQLAEVTAERESATFTRADHEAAKAEAERAPCRHDGETGIWRAGPRAFVRCFECGALLGAADHLTP